MYLAGVSVRRVEDITEALWGTGVSPSTVSGPGATVRSRASTRMFISTASCSSSWVGEVRNVSLLVAIGVNESGYREILGICEGAKEDKSGWAAWYKGSAPNRAQWALLISGATAA